MKTTLDRKFNDNASFALPTSLLLYMYLIAEPFNADKSRYGTILDGDKLGEGHSKCLQPSSEVHRLQFGFKHVYRYCTLRQAGKIMAIGQSSSIFDNLWRRARLQDRSTACLHCYQFLLMTQCEILSTAINCATPDQGLTTYKDQYMSCLGRLTWQGVKLLHLGDVQPALEADCRKLGQYSLLIFFKKEMLQAPLLLGHTISQTNVFPSTAKCRVLLSRNIRRFLNIILQFQGCRCGTPLTNTLKQGSVSFQGQISMYHSMQVLPSQRYGPLTAHTSLPESLSHCHLHPSCGAC